jgi:hypothetical protein
MWRHLMNKYINNRQRNAKKLKIKNEVKLEDVEPNEEDGGKKKRKPRKAKAAKPVEGTEEGE